MNDLRSLLKGVKWRVEGRQVAAVLGVDDYDSLIETLKLLSDEDALARHRVGVEQAQRGEVVSLEGLANMMRASSRNVRR